MHSICYHFNMFLLRVPKFSNISKISYSIRCISYVQGQEPEPKIREYFYYIDHQGMLFLDDSKMKNFTSCYKEKTFLTIFFRNIKKNVSGRYEEDFPYISLCGRERNFVRSDDYPIVYTHILKKEIDNHTNYLLSYGYAGDALTTEFIPEKVFMLPESGRVYHPAPEKAGSIGLIRSKLAIELSRNFTFEDGENKPPTQIDWDGRTYNLDKDWFQRTVKKKT